MKLMLVEDDAKITLLMTKVLRQINFDVHSYRDPIRALEAYKKEFFPIIISDIAMPEMSGLDFCREIRKLPKGKNSVIVMQTAFTTSFDTTHAIDAGADDYITKPLNIQLLKIRLAILKNVYAERMAKQKAEKDLKASKAKLKAILDNTQQSFILLDKNYDILAFNKNAEKQSKIFFGRPLSPGNPLQKYFTDEDFRELKPRLSKVLTGKPLSIDKSLKNIEQNLRWLTFNYDPVFDGEDVVGISVSVIDITERKNFEIALQESETKFRGLLESAPDPIVIINQDRKIVFVNKQTETKFAYTQEELLGKNVELLMPQRFREMHSNYCKNYIGHPATRPMGIGMELLCLRKDGTEFPVEVSLSPLELPSGMWITSVIHDISQRKNFEEELRKLHRAVEQSPTSVVITNVDGTIEYVNPAFTTVTGYTYDEAVGQNPRILKPKERGPENYADLWKVLLAGEIWYGEFRNVKKNGDYYWEAASIGPVMNDKGEITHYVAVKEDITTRKEAQEALKTSEQNLRHANATKDKFLSIIAHDLRNSFNVILSGSKFITDYGKQLDKEAVIKHSQMLHQSGENAYKLLENLLTWSRMQRGLLEFTPINMGVKGVIDSNFQLFSIIAQEKNITLEGSISDDIYVHADYQMFDTVVRNLINNALKFTGSGGKVQAFATEKDGMIEISIADTGVGIKSEYLPILFQIDSKHKTQGTAGEQGTGLGLPLCKEFIEKHQGKIWAESTLGEGSTFKFTLPKGQKGSR